MANKRMFSKQIIDSDAFLDMSPTAQLLYFHLVMRADDEGFVGNPKKIMREVGIQGDDFKVLVAKRFLIMFETGVVVIKHWLIHNTIRMDRFNQTAYQDEKNLLSTKENRAYTELATIGLHDGNQMETQVKLSKDNISKDRKESSLSFLELVPFEVALEFTNKFNCTNIEVHVKAHSLHDYCQSKGKVYKNYKSLLSNALRKDYGERPPKAKVPIYDTSTGVARIIGYK